MNCCTCNEPLIDLPGLEILQEKVSRCPHGHHYLIILPDGTRREEFALEVFAEDEYSPSIEATAVNIIQDIWKNRKRHVSQWAYLSYQGEIVSEDSLIPYGQRYTYTTE